MIKSISTRKFVFIFLLLVIHACIFVLIAMSNNLSGIKLILATVFSMFAVGLPLFVSLRGVSNSNSVEPGRSG